MIAQHNPATIRKTEMQFGDIQILQRKWQAAVTPRYALPRYEDVMLGSLGRLADHIILFNARDGEVGTARIGRYVQQWLCVTTETSPLDSYPRDCATSLREAAASALATGRPHLATAHLVRDGLVESFDLLALPTSTRWGDRIVGIYVNASGGRYNLLDNIFATTGEGFLSLAAIRDSEGRAFDLQVIHMNDAAHRLLGLPQVDLQWRRLGRGGHPLCTTRAMEWLLSALGEQGRECVEITVDDRDLRLSATAFGEIISLNITDVTILKKREQSFRLLFENNPVPMWIFDTETTCFLGVNDAAIEHYGYDRETFLGMKLPDIWPLDEREHHMAAMQQVGDSYRSPASWRHLRADGSEIEVLTYGRRVAFEGRGGFLVAGIDITERREAETRIAYMAHHDGLTDLTNRTSFQNRLRELLSNAASRTLAVLCIDLDLFKTVNDSFGHPVGDQLLQHVAARMRTAVTGANMVSRLGGDEFAVILASDASVQNVDEFAASLVKIVSAPYDIDGIEIVIGASIGIALSPSDGDNGDLLMRHADMALYRAKSEGGGVHHFFESEMDRQAQKRRHLETDLRHAFANGDFELHYQPQIDIARNRISGFEALLRWRHAEKGMISPADFIPIAEDIGLIGPLGDWVLRTACAEAARWPDDIKIAVNLSPVQFRNRHIVQTVVSALAQAGLSPLRLELEITESLFLAETEANVAILHRLRELGVRIAMDDFGTGYSSLSYLRSFPFDKIKIDRSFVHDLAERPDCAAIVRAISGLGKSLNIRTTAEGVETVGQLEWLRDEGCTEVQGFLFSAALPASGITALLATHNRDRGSRAA